MVSILSLFTNIIKLSILVVCDYAILVVPIYVRGTCTYVKVCTGMKVLLNLKYLVKRRVHCLK